jgi:uncharacterized protein (DUF4415 family)
MNNDNYPENLEDDLPAEYDEALLRDLLKNGVRGKYVVRYQQGTNLIKLDADLIEEFPTEQAVNDALRQWLKTNRLPA